MQGPGFLFALLLLSTVQPFVSAWQSGIQRPAFQQSKVESKLFVPNYRPRREMQEVINVSLELGLHLHARGATTTIDSCVSQIEASFPTNSALFCSGWTNGGTTQYIAPAFSTACTASNVYSRISSACTSIFHLSNNAITSTATSSTTDLSVGSCVSAVTSAFATNSAQFCSAWTASSQTTAFVGPAFVTSCPGNAYAQISSACTVLFGNAAVSATSTNIATTTTSNKAVTTSVKSNTSPSAVAPVTTSTAGASTSLSTKMFVSTLATSTTPSTHASIATPVTSTSLTAKTLPTTAAPSANQSSKPSVTASVVGTSQLPVSNCIAAITSAFPTNSALFCGAWTSTSQTTAYVGAQFSTSCSGNVYAQISSACTALFLSPGTTATVNPASASPASAGPVSAAATNTTLDIKTIGIASASTSITTSKTSAASTTIGSVSGSTATVHTSATRSITTTGTASSTTTTASSSVVASRTITGTATLDSNCVRAISTAYSTNAALFCSGWLKDGTTQYVLPAFSTSCTPGNVYSQVTAACDAIISPASWFTSATQPSTTIPYTYTWSNVASFRTISIPTPTATFFHGNSNLTSNLFCVPNQYAWSQVNPLPQLSSSSLNTTGVNNHLTSDYPLASNLTGGMTVAAGEIIQTLNYQPGLSRDIGKGGVLNGVKMFIFADTTSSSPANSTTLGTFQGFVSNSVAIDVGTLGAQGKPLNLQDGTGEWAGSTGSKRGFFPLTTAEAAYNEANEANGKRYAIWPESSIIPIDSQSAVMYAPIVYNDVNYTSGVALYPFAGVTLAIITVPGVGGPVANRVAPLLFSEDSLPWGCVGGVRSWGSSGPGGNDGMVYIFAAAADGLLLAKVAPSHVSDVTQYQYYQGSGVFNSTMPMANSSAVFMTGAYSTLDVFYSPRHQTFIMVFMSNYADNALHWRYLLADHGIVPGYQGGVDADYVANIYKYAWSTPQLLLDTPVPSGELYTYGGGSFSGYYDAQDLAYGGTKMLTTWTYPTGEDPGAVDTSYFHQTAEVDWA